MTRTFLAQTVSLERYGFLASQREVLTAPVMINAALAVDGVGGHTPTSTLRSGLVLTRITATGLYAHFDSTAIDGRADESTAVILIKDIDLTKYGTTNNIEAGVVVAGDISFAQLFVGSGFVQADCNHLVFVPGADLDSIG